MRLPRLLARDRRGSPTAEFAVVLPAMLALIMGLAELAYTSYVRVILAGAMQKAARDSGIEGGDVLASDIDAKVIASVRAVALTAKYKSTRTSFQKFGYISGEPFSDTDNDGLCDHGESFSDVNGNGTWDKSIGSTGQGNASDATVYTMAISFPRLFPVAKIVGMSSTAELTSTVILKNQPYATRTVATPATKICK